MEVVNMVKKSKIDFVSAHQLSKTKLKKNTKNKPVSKPTFSDRLNDASFRGPQDKVLSDVKTGHRKRETEHLKIKNGPEGIAAFGGEF